MLAEIFLILASKLGNEKEVQPAVNQQLNELVNNVQYSQISSLKVLLNQFNHRKSDRMINNMNGTSNYMKSYKRPKKYVQMQQIVQNSTARSSASQRKATDHNKLSDSIMHSLKTNDTVTAEKETNMTRTPPVNDAASKDGQGLVWHNGTLKDVVNFYRTVKLNRKLNIDQVVEYLQKKFIEDCKHFCGGEYGELFVDRMIAFLFKHLSEKLELRPQIVEKLFVCLDSLDNLKQSLINVKIKKNSTRIVKKYFEDVAKYPDIVTDAAIRINKECVRTDSNGKSSVDRDKLNEIIMDELNKLRIDCLEALYNYFSNYATISPSQLEKIQNQLGDSNITYRENIIKLLTMSNDIQISDLRNIFDKCLAQLRLINDTSEGLDYSLRFLKKISKDYDKCKQLLMTQNNTLIGDIRCAFKQAQNIKQKLTLCQIINNCLQQKDFNGYEYLDDFITTIESTDIEELSTGDKVDIKIEATACILTTAIKSKGTLVSRPVINALLNNMNRLDETVSDYVIIILDCTNYAITDLDLVATKLASDMIVCENEDDRITIEQQSSDMTSANNDSIAFLTAKIIAHSLKQKQQTNELKFTRKTTENLLDVLESEDKQARIQAAKSLHLIASITLDKHCNSNHNHCPDQSFVEVIKLSDIYALRSYLNDSTADVAVYSILAYVDGVRLLSLSSSQSSIELVTCVNTLPTIYALPDLILDDVSYIDTVKKTILDILKHEISVKRTNFDDYDDMFKIFDHILTYEKEFLTEALDLLMTHVCKKKPLPHSTINLLEYTFHNPEVKDQVAAVFEIVISNGQQVDEKALEMFVNDLFYAEDNDSRDKAFRILDNSFENQDLSDKIFDPLELQRAGVSIVEVKSDRLKALDYLNQKMSANLNLKLPIDTMHSLTYVLDQTSSLKLLENLASNHQAIPQYLMDRLIDHLGGACRGAALTEIETFNFVTITNIILDIVQVNPNLSQANLSTLTQMLDDSNSTSAYIEEQILLVFANLWRAGKSISNEIIDKLIDWYTSHDGKRTFKIELLPVICSFLQNSTLSSSTPSNSIVSSHLIPKYNAVVQMLIKNLTAHANQVDMDMFAKYLKILSTNKLLNNEIINQLAELIMRSNFTKEFRSEFYDMIDLNELDERIRYQFIFIKLNDNTSTNSSDNAHNTMEILNKLKMNSKVGAILLTTNFYTQLDTIIKNSCNQPHIISEYIDLLLTLPKIDKELPDSLIQTLVYLTDYSVSDDFHAKCIQLLVKIADSDKQLSSELVRLVISKIDDTNLLKLISKKHRTSSLDDLDLMLEAFSDNSTQTIFNCKTKYSLISEPVLSALINTTERQLVKDADRLQMVTRCAKILQENPMKFSKNPAIINVILKHLLERKLIVERVIDVFTTIIKSNAADSDAEEFRQKCKSIFAYLSDAISNVSSEKLKVAILKSFVRGIEHGIYTTGCFQVLEENLSSASVKLRSLSFRGLRMAYEKRLLPGNEDRDSITISFLNWCNNEIVKFEKMLGTWKQTGGEISFDLLDTIALTKHLTLLNLKKLPRTYWNKSLLFNNLTRRFNLSHLQGYQFYKRCPYELVRNDERLLIVLNHLMIDGILKSLDQINFILKLSQHFNFEKLYSILDHSGYAFEELKIEWIQKLITDRLMNKSIRAQYIHKLAIDACSTFPFTFLEAALNALKEIESLSKFKLFLDFLVEKKVQEHDIYMREATIDDLKKSIELILLTDQISLGSSSMRYQILAIFECLINTGWTYTHIHKLIETFKNRTMRRQDIKLLDIFRIINEFKINSSHYKRIEAILANTEEKFWLKEINKIAIDVYFEATKKLFSTKELVAELRALNIENLNLVDTIDKQVNLLDALSTILNYEGVKTNVKNFLAFPAEKEYIANRLVEAGEISKWTEEDIALWASLVKATDDIRISSQFQLEYLAVLKRANSLIDLQLRPNQILSFLVAANNVKSCLLEVSTGEGKTMIASMLAIFACLRRNAKVDIITSSPVLAARDAMTNAKLYKMFGLTCSDNTDKFVYVRGQKPCYRADIVYGEVSQFQFDTLRNDYSCDNTLAGRKCHMVIVDEVDSLLIDDSSKIARLASTTPGMDLLQPIYHYIWHRISHLTQRIVEIKSNFYYFEANVTVTPDNRKQLEYISSDKKSKIIPDLSILTKEELSRIGDLIGPSNELESFVKKKLTDYVRQLIRLKKHVLVPKRLEEFVDQQIPKWIESAFMAKYGYHEREQYVVENGEIKLVDYETTGCVQEMTSWGEGLHQYLQLKHNLKMTCQTHTTNFLSNVGYFERYSTKLIGLSGTLGSPKAKKLLEVAYKVDIFAMPLLNKKQWLEYAPKITENRDTWAKTICRSAHNEVSKGRGCLVICETILVADELFQYLNQNLPAHFANKLKLYSMNKKEQEKDIKKIMPAEIFVSTNLAGRGLDINTNDIEQYGGLHVIISYLQSSQRAERQAFGRTSRQGNRGTGEIILNGSDLKSIYKSLANIKQQRDEQEAKELESFNNTELKMIEKKDALFGLFCVEYNKVREAIQNKQSLYSKVKDNVVHGINKMLRKKQFAVPVFETNVLDSVEEEWVRFLANVDNGKISLDDSDDAFGVKIKTKIDAYLDAINNEKYKELIDLIENPFYHINIGNDIVRRNEWVDGNNYDHAMMHFDRAITLDEQVSASAHFGKAWLLIKGRERLVRSNKLEPENKKKALHEFEKACVHLNDEKSILMAVKTVLCNSVASIMVEETYLSQQLIQKIDILDFYLSNIYANITSIRKSLRLFDVTANWLNGKLEIRDIQKKTVKADCYEIKKFSSLAAMKKKPYYDVCFHHLTVSHDSGTHDQAIETIDRNGSILKKQPNNLTVSIVDMTAEKFDLLFSSDIVVKGLNKKDTLNHLENKRAHWYNILTEDPQVIVEKCAQEKQRADEEESDHETIMLSNENIIKQVKAQDALKQIKADKDEHAVYNLTFKNVNEVYEKVKELMKKQSHQKIQFEFETLSPKSLKQIVEEKQLDSMAMELQLTAKSDELATALDFLDGCAYIDLFDEKNDDALVWNRMCVGDVKSHLKWTSETVSKISIKDFDTIGNNVLVNEILNKFDTLIKLTFTIEWQKFNNEKTKQFIQTIIDGNECVNLKFLHLESSNATKLVSLVRKQNFEFSLTLEGLSLDQLKQAIENASLNQEDIEIMRVKSLSELYLKEYKPTQEIEEFAARGIHYTVEMSEKPSIPWRSILLVSGLAAIQIAAGGVLISTGFGSTLGLSLVTEGAADLFIAYRAYRSRHFRWSSYLKQKTVSLAISAVSMGLSGVKDAAKGLKTLSSAVLGEVTEQAATNLLINGKTVGQVSMMASKNLMNLALKQIGVSVANATARQCLNDVATKLTHFTLDQFKQQISDLINEKVINSMKDNTIYSCLQMMKALETINSDRRHQMKNRIDGYVAKIINPQHNFWRKQWESVGNPLCQGILADPKFLGSPFSMAIRIATTFNGIYQLNGIIDKVFADLKKRLVANDLRFSNIFLSEMKQTQAFKLEQQLTGIYKLDVTSLTEEQVDMLKQCTFDQDLQQYKNTTISVLKQIVKKSKHVTLNDLSVELKSISDLIADEIIKISESQIVSPWSMYATGHLVNTVSECVQDALIKLELNQDIETIQEKLKKLDTANDHEQIRELKFDLNEKLALLSERQTYVNLIAFESTKYAKAYLQMEQIYYAKKIGLEETSLILNAEDRTMEYNNDSRQAADLADMFMIASTNGINLKIVDDLDYQLTADDRANNVQVVVFVPGDYDPNTKVVGIGHYYLKDADSKLLIIFSDQSDCGYAIFSHLTKKSVDQLRNETRILHESTNYNKIVASQSYVNERFPEQANSILFRGAKGSFYGPRIEITEKPHVVGNITDVGVALGGYEDTFNINGVEMQCFIQPFIDFTVIWPKTVVQVGCSIDELTCSYAFDPFIVRNGVKGVLKAIEDSSLTSMLLPDCEVDTTIIPVMPIVTSAWNKLQDVVLGNKEIREMNLTSEEYNDYLFKKFVADFENKKLHVVENKDGKTNYYDIATNNQINLDNFALNNFFKFENVDDSSVGQVESVLKDTFNNHYDMYINENFKDAFNSKYAAVDYKSMLENQATGWFDKNYKENFAQIENYLKTETDYSTYFRPSKLQQLDLTTNISDMVPNTLDLSNSNGLPLIKFEKPIEMPKGPLDNVSIGGHYNGPNDIRFEVSVSLPCSIL